MVQKDKTSNRAGRAVETKCRAHGGLIPESEPRFEVTPEAAKVLAKAAGIDAERVDGFLCESCAKAKWVTPEDIAATAAKAFIALGEEGANAFYDNAKATEKRFAGEPPDLNESATDLKRQIRDSISAMVHNIEAAEHNFFEAADIYESSGMFAEAAICMARAAEMLVKIKKVAMGWYMGSATHQVLPLIGSNVTSGAIAPAVFRALASASVYYDMVGSWRSSEALRACKNALEQLGDMYLLQLGDTHVIAALLELGRIIKKHAYSRSSEKAAILFTYIAESVEAGVGLRSGAPEYAFMLPHRIDQNPQPELHAKLGEVFELAGSHDKSQKYYRLSVVEYYDKGLDLIARESGAPPYGGRRVPGSVLIARDSIAEALRISAKVSQTVSDARYDAAADSLLGWLEACNKCIDGKSKNVILLR